MHTVNNYYYRDMKKYFSTLAVVAALVFAVPAQAQLQFGLKAGLNVSKMKLDKDVVDANNRTGFFVGPMAEFTLPIVGLGMDAALLYDQKGVEMEAEGVKVNDKLHYIDLPINLKYSVGLGSLASAFLATGPQFSFNVGGKKIFKEQYELKSSEFSWNIGVGAKLVKHLQVAYNYNIGLGATADVNEGTAASALWKAATGKLKNNTHQISVAYMF